MQRSVGISVLKRRVVLSVTKAGKEDPQQGTHQHIYTRQESKCDFNVTANRWGGSLCVGTHDTSVWKAQPLPFRESNKRDIGWSLKIFMMFEFASGDCVNMPGCVNDLQIRGSCLYHIEITDIVVVLTLPVVLVVTGSGEGNYCCN